MIFGLPKRICPTSVRLGDARNTACPASPQGKGTRAEVRADVSRETSAGVPASPRPSAAAGIAAPAPAAGSDAAVAPAPVAAAAPVPSAPAPTALVSSSGPAPVSLAPAAPAPSAPAAFPSPTLLVLERIAVRADRISVLVRLAPGAPRRTDAVLAARVVAAFPDLPRHACVNDRGSTFSSVMNDTPLPHLLEHLVISLMLRDDATPAHAVHVGTTEWLNEAEGLARVEVTYTDDLVALRALRDATAFLNDEGRE